MNAVVYYSVTLYAYKVEIERDSRVIYIKGCTKGNRKLA